MTTQALAHQYRDKLPIALLNFQWIEESLKQYLGKTEWMIATVVSTFMSYTPDVKQFENAPLGTLVRSFQQRNANTRLHTGLSELVKARNLCAHKGYLLLQTPQDDPEALREALHTLDQTLTASATCLTMITAEVTGLDRRFRAVRTSGIPPALAQQQEG